MPKRTRPLTPWGREVKMRMLAMDLSNKELVSKICGTGVRVNEAKLSMMLSGAGGQRMPEVIAAIDSLLGIPADVVGRPA